MAFKKARSHNLHKERIIIDDTTEEILDYLLRSKSFLSDITLIKLNQKIKISFKKKFSEFLCGLMGMKKVNGSKNLLIIFLAVFCCTGSSYKVYAISNDMQKKIINITKDKNNLVNLRGSDFSDNKLIPVAEESKHNLTGIKPGQPLVLIPQNSSIHTVKKGENPVTISNKYNISLKNLISVNPKVNFLKLTAGNKIIIPDTKVSSINYHRYQLASRGFSPSVGFSSDRLFKWPTQGKQISSGFGERGFRRHTGVDIAGDYGEPITAAKSGIVTFTGWNGNYGECVIIDHGYGIQTLYSHASRILINTGDTVYAGQKIAKIGTTGRATGPHLHFEIILNGVQKNPERYLR